MSLLIAAIITVLGVAIFAALAFGPTNDPWDEDQFRDNQNRIRKHPRRVWEDEK